MSLPFLLNLITELEYILVIPSCLFLFFLISFSSRTILHNITLNWVEIKKLWFDLIEIWQSSDRNNFAQFFSETRCINLLEANACTIPLLSYMSILLPLHCKFSRKRGSSLWQCWHTVGFLKLWPTNVCGIWILGAVEELPAPPTPTPPTTTVAPLTPPTPPPRPWPLRILCPPLRVPSEYDDMLGVEVPNWNWKTQTMKHQTKFAISRPIFVVNIHRLQLLME